MLGHVNTKKTEILGSTAQACPYCGVVLGRMPKRKTKCRDCGQFIFVRTRPQDEQKVLLRQDELAELAQQWALQAEREPRIMARPAEVRERVTESLTRQFGRSPSESDVLWRIFNEEILQYSSSEEWGFYTQVQFEMGELLMSEGKYKPALHQYFTALILSINGPRNIDRELVKSGYSRFSGEGFCAGLYLDRVKQMIRNTEIKDEDLKEIFFSLASDLQKTLLLPLTPEEAWKCLTSTT